MTEWLVNYTWLICYLGGWLVGFYCAWDYWGKNYFAREVTRNKRLNKKQENTQWNNMIQI